MSNQIEKLDLAVIGAGYYGLAAAKQYKHFHPNARIAIFDPASTLGGVWAKHRLYPGLKSNNLLGTFEYPDFPMDTATFGVKKDEHPSGQVIYDYQVAYAKKFGIFDLIQFETKVVSAEHQQAGDGGWVLTLLSGFNAGKDALQETSVYARRIVVATGLTCEPFMPRFDGQESFGGPIFHSADFLKNEDTLKTTKVVTVFGGTKSAWDAVYEYGIRGIKVNWIIRASGHGPCWMAPSYVTPFKKWIEKLVNTRFLTWFSPCIWGAEDGFSRIRSFWHGTAIGRAIVNAFWNILGQDTKDLCGFSKHPEVAKLEPWTQAMFASTSFSILNYDTDFFEIIRNGTVKVHIADIERLSPGHVHLHDGTTVPSDAFVSVTGWKYVPQMKFLPEGIEKELGIPHLLSETEANDPKDLASQKALLERADKEIFTRLPRLRDQPTGNKRYVPLEKQKGISTTDKITPQAPLTQYMMHRFLVPPSERFLRNRDVVFCGAAANFSNLITAHVQALWASAYFDGKLVRDPVAVLDDPSADGKETGLEKLRYETVLWNRSLKWRYPEEHRFPSFVFDAVPYMDVLLHDLGLNIYRKKGWWKNITNPYGPEDYIGVNQEWKAKHGWT